VLSPVSGGASSGLFWNSKRDYGVTTALY